MVATAPKQFGPYTIEKLLVNSAAETAYLASADGKRVVLRLPPKALRADADFLERFRAEGQAAAAINHPGVARVLGVEEHGGTPAVISEYVEGKPLSAFLAAKLPPAKVVTALKQSLEAIGAVHAGGVVHRWIGPDALRLSPKGRVVITGLGWPRLTSHDRKQGGITDDGITPYMSPEQVRGEPLTARTDLYNIGAVFYHLLTGRAPYEDAGVRLRMTIPGKLEPPMIRQLNREAPATLARVVHKLMTKDSKSRYFKVENAMRDLTGEAPVAVSEMPAEVPSHPTSTEAVPEEEEEYVEEAPRAGIPGWLIGVGIGGLVVAVVIGLFIYKTLSIDAPAVKPVKPTASDLPQNTSPTTTEVVTSHTTETPVEAMPDITDVRTRRLREDLPNLWAAAVGPVERVQYLQAAQEFGAIVARITTDQLDVPFAADLESARRNQQIANQMSNAVAKYRGVADPETARPDLEAIRPFITEVSDEKLRGMWSKHLERALNELTDLPCQRAYEQLAGVWSSNAATEPATMKARFDQLAKHPDCASARDALKAGRQLYDGWVAQLKTFIENEDSDNAPRVLQQLRNGFGQAPWAAELPELIRKVEALAPEE